MSSQSVFKWSQNQWNLSNSCVRYLIIQKNRSLKSKGSITTVDAIWMFWILDTKWYWISRFLIQWFSFLFRRYFCIKKTANDQVFFFNTQNFFRKFIYHDTLETYQLWGSILCDSCLLCTSDSVPVLSKPTVL